MIGTTADSVPLTAREAASGLLGSVSLACWVFLLVPQLIENYKYGSADALSLSFLIVWFIGDLANLVGALWAHLVPVIIAIAVYYCLADGVLITQVVYYNTMNAREDARKLRMASSNAPRNGRGPAVAGHDHDHDHDVDHTTPLLSRGISDVDNDYISGWRRRSSHRSNRHLHREVEDSLVKIMNEVEPKTAWVKNILSLMAIGAIGTAGWVVAWRTGVWKPTPEMGPGDVGGPPLGAEILGYFSAVCYLGARIPQIVKNYREKSCEGLSLLFFLLSLIGNMTYGAGILAHSTQREYVLTNIPWLIGSLGTMIEDIAIFVQFHIYAIKEDSVSPVGV